MDSGILDLKIKTGDTLNDFENYNSQLKANIHEVHMHLAKNYKRQFFNDSWISSLIAKASSGERRLVLTEWWDKSNDDNIALRLSDSLIGITSVYLADSIQNSKHQQLNIDVQQIVETVALHKKGVIDDTSSGHTFTFCSFDSADQKKYFPRPLALSAENVTQFTDKFLKIKRDRIDRAFGIQYGTNSLFPEYDTYQSEKNFAALVYELYENTIQHGNKNESNHLIEGIRSFTIKRHAFSQMEDLKNVAKNFTELTKYLSVIAEKRKQRNLMFYEISIVDNGIGIIKRFLASRSDYSQNEQFNKLSDFEKLNFIIEKSLSSKLFPGAGKGIKGALRNINSLNAFVSLRTNNLWAYFDGTGKASSDTFIFDAVKTELQLDTINGTCYNILIPVAT